MTAGVRREEAPMRDGFSILNGDLCAFAARSVAGNGLAVDDQGRVWRASRRGGPKP